VSFAAGQKEREVVVVRAGSVDVVSEDEVDVAVPDGSLVLSLSLYLVSIHHIVQASELKTHPSLEPEESFFSDSELLFELDTPTPTPTPTAITSASITAASTIQKVLFLIPHLLESLGNGAGGAT
jgi:hypothetical protein